MEALLRDIKHALRMFRNSPVFATTAILALAVGIGANTATFSVVNAVLLKPLPFPDPDRLVFIVQSFNGAPTMVWASPTDFAHWRSQTETLEDVTAWHNVSLDYTAGDVPESVTASSVSEAYFRALGATFVAGRSFSSEEDSPGAGSTVVLSHEFWTRRLNADPDVVGTTISLNGVAHTVLGITTEDFDVRELGIRGPSEPDVWVPLQITPSTTDTMRFLDVFARLKDGVTLEYAQQRIAASLNEYRERFPEDEYDDWGFTVTGMREAIVRDSRPMLLMLTGAVGLVLLIACANVATLLLGRALSRNREVAICSVLGAGRWRIARQLLIESLLLALAGGALGLVAGLLGIRWLLSIDTADLPRLPDLVGLDWRVMTFVLSTSVITALVFGLVPALVSARTDLNAVLKNASTRSSGDRRQTRTQSFLVTTQMGLAVVLVVGAGLLIRTLLALGSVDLGLSVENVLTMRTSLAEPRFRSTAGITQITDRVLERIRSIPGVAAATSSWGVPLQDNAGVPFNISGRENVGPSTGAGVVVPSSPDYFETLQIQLLAGRRFDEGDDGGAAAVVVINQAMAEQYWADGSDPLAGRIRIGTALMPETANEPERRVIGIVGNVRQRGAMADPEPTMYFPHAQGSNGVSEALASTARIAWIVRTAIDPRTVSAEVQEAVRLETGQPVTDVRLMAETWVLSISRQRLNMWLMTIFGGSALLLGAIGIYGLMTYSAQQRRQEIGIRLALGAEAAAVRNMVVKEGMLLVLIGIGVGIGAAYVFANLLASVLFGVDPHDVAVFVTVPAVLAAVAFVAVIVPAVRTSRADPTEALRYT
jgi:predicted permease